MQCWPVATASRKTPIRAPSSPPPARQGRGARSASGSPQAASPPPWTRLNERGTDLRAGPGGIRREAAPARGRQAQPGGHAEGGRRGPHVPEDLRSQAGSGAGQDRDASSRRLRAASGHGGWNGTRAGGGQALLRELRVGEDVLGRDGRRIGHVEGLVVDEGAHQVTHLVVGQRALPLREFRDAGPDGLATDLGGEADLERFPSHADEQFGPPGEKVLIPVQKVIEVVGPNVQVDLNETEVELLEPYEG